MTDKKDDAKVEKTATVSDGIWNKIKNLQLDLFGLPDQIVSDNVSRHEILEDKVHLTLKAPAVLISLEDALQKVKLPANQSFEIVQVKNYTVISIVNEI